MIRPSVEAIGDRSASGAARRRGRFCERTGPVGPDSRRSRWCCGVAVSRLPHNLRARGFDPLGRFGRRGRRPEAGRGAARSTAQGRMAVNDSTQLRTGCQVPPSRIRRFDLL